MMSVALMLALQFWANFYYIGHVILLIGAFGLPGKEEKKEGKAHGEHTSGNKTQAKDA